MIAAEPKPNAIELLKSLYAMDAKEIKTPWERWQYRLMDESRDTYQWSQATKEINFEQDKLEYRRAPYAPALLVITEEVETAQETMDRLTRLAMADITPLYVEQDINATLAERGSRYGPFKGHAEITQKLKDVIYTHPKSVDLSNSHREALDMICHKIGRIVNGDPLYIDSWFDISGYAQLIVKELDDGK